MWAGESEHLRGGKGGKGVIKQKDITTSNPEGSEKERVHVPGMYKELWKIQKDTCRRPENEQIR